MSNLSKVEDRIVREVARRILAAGHRITVNDGEEDTSAVNCLRLAEVMAEVGHTDETVFKIYSRDERNHLGFVYFVHGNEEDVISDHSDTELVQALVAGVY